MVSCVGALDHFCDDLDLDTEVVALTCAASGQRRLVDFAKLFSEEDKVLYVDAVIALARALADPPCQKRFQAQSNQQLLACDMLKSRRIQR